MAADDLIRPGEYRRIKIDGKLLGDQRRSHLDELRKFYDPQGKTTYGELERAEFEDMDAKLRDIEIVDTN